jgi:hypothetical protein
MTLLRDAQDAAEFYVLDGQLEKAVDIYISVKDHTKARSSLETIASPKFYVMVSLSTTFSFYVRYLSKLVV